MSNQRVIQTTMSIYYFFLFYFDVIFSYNHFVLTREKDYLREKKGLKKDVKHPKPQQPICHAKRKGKSKYM